MKKLKVLAFIIGLIMISFGFYNFLTAASTEDGKLVAPLPINNVNGITVDQKPNLYWRRSEQ